MFVLFNLFVCLFMFVLFVFFFWPCQFLDRLTLCHTQVPSLKNIVALKTLLMILPFFGHGRQHLETRERKFYKLVDKSLLGNVTATKEVQDFLDCSFLCLQYGPFACLSFNFGRNGENGYHSCELSNSERYLEPHKIHDRPGVDYYGPLPK